MCRLLAPLTLLPCVLSPPCCCLLHRAPAAVCWCHSLQEHNEHPAADDPGRCCVCHLLVPHRVSSLVLDVGRLWFWAVVVCAVVCIQKATALHRAARYLAGWLPQAFGVCEWWRVTRLRPPVHLCKQQTSCQAHLAVLLPNSRRCADYPLHHHHHHKSPPPQTGTALPGATPTAATPLCRPPALR